MYIKIFAILFPSLSSIIQIILDNLLKEKKPKIRTTASVILVIMTIISCIFAIKIVVQDNDEAQNTIISLNSLLEKSNTSLKHSEQLARDAELREEKAKNDRKLIQQELNEIQNNIKPIIEIAVAKYPNISTEEALKKISIDIEKLENNLEKQKSIIHSMLIYRYS